MKCEKAQDLFSEHLEGALERPMAVAFERHLAECCPCERDYASFKMTWEMLEMLPEVAPPPGFAYDVVMTVRMQREAEERARTRWQVIWNDLFAPRTPARVFAVALLILLCAAVVLRTPIKNTIISIIVPTPTVEAPGGDTGSSLPFVLPPPKPQPAEAWLRSGLSFELDPSNSAAGGVFRLFIRPKGVTKKYVRVYLMERGQPSFDDASIGRSHLIFEGYVREPGQVIPFVLGRSGQEQEVITALVDWQHRQRRFLEAVFVPTQLSAMGAAREGSLHISNMQLYSALQEVSAVYGVVVLAHADVNAKVTSVSVENGTADDALWKICTNVGLRWRPLGAQVYIVERKIASVE